MKFDYYDTNDDCTYSVSFENIQSICPFCETGVKYVPIVGIKNIKGYYFLVECPSCHYCTTLHNVNSSNSLTNLTPVLKHIDIPKNIQELSSRFCHIYTDTLRAEAFGLHTIIGVGLCKALECLVYDYLIKVQNDKPVKNLSQNISMLKGFEDDIIQLSFAKFIRNNEVHPEKETEYTVEDLKETIECLISLFNAKYSTFKLKNKSNEFK